MDAQVIHFAFITDLERLIVCCRIIDKERKIGISYPACFCIKVKMFAQCGFYTAIIFYLFGIVLPGKRLQVRVDG